MTSPRDCCVYKGDRLVFHSDINYFYAQVVERMKPWLKGKPFIVGGTEETRSGIILAKSPATKPFRIKTAMTTWEAKKLCRDLHVEYMTDRLWDEISWASQDFEYRCKKYSDLYQMFGPDGIWFEVTGSSHLFGGIYKIATELQDFMRREEGLTISTGFSRNKTLSKFASELKKPDGIRFIVRSSLGDEDWKDMVYPHPVSSMIGIGHARERDLNRLGVYTLGQMAKLTERDLVEMWGIIGHVMYSYVQGTENEPLYPDAPPPNQSFSAGSTTPHDLTTWEEYWVQTCVMAEKVGRHVREARLLAKTIEIGVTYVDEYKQMRYASWQCPLTTPTCLTMDYARGAFGLLRKRFKPKPIRKITVRVKDMLYATDPRQTLLSMSAARQEQLENLEYVVDDINERWPLGVRRAVAMSDADLSMLGVKRAAEFFPPGMWAV